MSEIARKERVMNKASRRVKRPLPFLEDKGLHEGIQ